MLEWRIFLHRNYKFITVRNKCSKIPTVNLSATLQHLCEDRVLFVWVDLHVSLCSQQHPKCDIASNSSRVSTFLLQTSLFNETNKQNAWFQSSAAKQMRTALFWVITQRPLIIPHRRFSTTYRSHLQGSRFWPFTDRTWHFKIGPTGCPETSIRNHQY